METDSRDRFFLSRAIDEAATNIEEGGGPFGAVIVKNGEVIASAGNRVVTEHDPTAHAEVLAIRKAAAATGTHDLSGCVIYSSCEPCPMCLGAIYWAGISRVIYASDRHRAAAAGFSDGFIYSELSLDPGERSIEMRSEMTEEGNKVFDRWDEYPGKILY